MQLLSYRYTFKEEIDKLNKCAISEIDKIDYDSIVKDLYVSPANKREIWQTIQIAEEVKKVMGCDPKKIFIEMARGNDDRTNTDKQKSSKGRKEWLKSLYDTCDAEDKKIWENELSKLDEGEFSSMKLFLYSIQMGKCMYTGERIDLDELMSKNSKWDKDHIYPQSKIEDDSIDNLVLVNKKYNAKKSNEMLSEDIQNNKGNKEHWKYLYEKEFISKKKYDRLRRRTEFTEEELTGFISRQLVETGQASKAVADVFKQIYPKSKIVYVKAKLVSKFRNRELFSLKSRLLNDYHHAKDAYLNIVVGNVYNATFTDNPLNWLKENKDNKYSINAVFYRGRKEGNNTVWEFGEKDDTGKITGGTMDLVRKTVEKNNILYTEYTYCDKGELFNAMPKKPKKKGNEASIPLKAGLDPEKYGGYDSAKTSYFAMVEFDEKKGKRSRIIIAVPCYISNMLEHNKNAFIEYCEKVKGFNNVKVILPRIKKNTILKVDGFAMRLTGESGDNLLFKNSTQLIIDKDSAEIIRRIEKIKSKGIDEKRYGISDSDLNTLYSKLIEKLETAYKGRLLKLMKPLKNKKEDFEKLDSLMKKVDVIYAIMRFLKCDGETRANLTYIGEKENAGKMARRANTISKSKITIINQSVTGLFEKRIHL